MIDFVATKIPQFWERVLPEPNSGCWIWTGSITGPGYGTFCARKNLLMLAHRFSYVLHKGEIPAGLEIDHLCRVRCCVNPDHLEAVTHRENGLRGVSGAADNARKTHCVNGHELAGENLLVISTRPGRHCKACHYARARQRKRQKRLMTGYNRVPRHLWSAIPPRTPKNGRRRERVMANCSPAHDLKL